MVWDFGSNSERGVLVGHVLSIYPDLKLGLSHCFGCGCVGASLGRLVANTRDTRFPIRQRACCDMPAVPGVIRPLGSGRRRESRRRVPGFPQERKCFFSPERESPPRVFTEWCLLP